MKPKPTCLRCTSYFFLTHSFWLLSLSWEDFFIRVLITDLGLYRLLWRRFNWTNWAFQTLNMILWYMLFGEYFHPRLLWAAYIFTVLAPAGFGPYSNFGSVTVILHARSYVTLYQHTPLWGPMKRAKLANKNAQHPFKNMLIVCNTFDLTYSTLTNYVFYHQHKLYLKVLSAGCFALIPWLKVIS